jgi:hypothetical protein
MRTLPSIEMWNALIGTWKRMNEEEPWNWLGEYQLIGVQDPFSGEMGFCRFVGQRPEVVPGMELLLGSPGLAGLIELRNHPGMNSYELMTVRSKLDASTSNRSVLERSELDAYKRLQLKFRNNWPCFRSYDQGYLPCMVDFDEARTLLLAMDQALDVAKRAKTDKNLLLSWDDVTQPIFTRTSKITGDRIIWGEAMRKPQPVMIAVASLPDDLIVAFREEMCKKPRGKGIMFLSCPYLLRRVVEDGRGRLRVPRIMIFVDASNNEIVSMTIYGRDMDVLMPIGLIDGLMAGKEIPHTLIVSDDFTEALVSNIVPRLGVRVRRVDSLPEAEAVAKNAVQDLEAEQMNEEEDAPKKKKR